MLALPEPRRLYAHGRAVLEFRPFATERPTADEARPLAPLDLVIPAVFRDLSGWFIASEHEDLTQALLAAGATIARHALLMSLDLGKIDHGEPQVVPASEASFIIAPIASDGLEFGELVVRAYPPSHPDFTTLDPVQAQAEIAGIIDGSLLGPFLAEPSALVRDRGRLVAACLITRLPGHAPHGGPWVGDVFRDPDPAYRGLGSTLLRRAIRVLAENGEPSLSLAVTEGNRAGETYRRLGFVEATHRRKLLIPSRQELAPPG